MTESKTLNEAQAFCRDFAACWQRLPNKIFFFTLLAAWAALFHFLGNSTFGYIDTPSLFVWRYLPRATLDIYDEHGFGSYLVPLVVLGLFWWKRRELLAAKLETWLPGLGLLALALAAHIFGYMAQQPVLSIMALFLGIYAIMGLAWGMGWLRASFFPFFLLGFSLPLGSLSVSLTFPLRILATWLSVGLAHLVGIDVIREGTQIFDAQHSFNYDVAPACSGIRSLLLMLVFSTVYGFVMFRAGWKRAVLVASALPLAVAGNVFRLVLIILAAELFGQEAGNFVHENSILSLLPYVPAFVGWVILGRWLGEPKEKKS